MDGPLGRLVELTDRIGGNGGAVDGDRTRRRLLVGLAVISIPIGVLWGGLYLLFSEPIAALPPLLHSVGAAANLAIFHRTGGYRGLRFRLLGQFLILPFALMLALGDFGVSSVVIIWGFLAPAGSLVFDDPKRAIRWFAAYLGLLVLAGFLDPFLRTSNHLPDVLVLSLFILNIGTLSMIAFGLIALFAAQREAALTMANREHERADDLLRNMLPESIAERLKHGSRRIAEHFDEASILFADVVGFTPLSARLEPGEVVELLDRLFTEFDRLVDAARLEKIKTIGDAYMVAAGVPDPRPDHAPAIVQLGLEMLAAVAAMPEPRLELRIGVNSGPVVAGVIGRRRLIYDLWGDTVNVASRMESQGIPGRIQLTRATFDLIGDRFACERHGIVAVKGRGDLETWFVIGPRADWPRDSLIPDVHTASMPVPVNAE